MHRARKRFGQNFLQDDEIIYSIIALINPGPDMHVIEIGPGLGALTLPLLRNLDQLDLLEIDRDLVAYWKQQNLNGLTVIEGDALQFNFLEWARNRSNKKGFCVSPQKTDGTLMGSLIAGSGNQVTNTKYVTHTNYKTTNPGVWAFQWVAPAKGAGKVDFYGAFAVTQSTTYTEKISVLEAIPAGLSANATFNLTNLYPNPISAQELNIGFELKMAAQVKLTLIDITGEEVVMLKSEMMNSGMHQNTYDLPQLSKGIYFLRIETNNDVLTKKVLVQ